MTETQVPVLDQQKSKRRLQDARPAKKRKLQKKQKLGIQGSHEEVLLADVRLLLREVNSSQEEESILEEPFSEIDVEITSTSSTGDGLGMSTAPSSSNQVYVVPFSLPGDTVRVKVIKHFREEQYSMADFLRVIKPSSMRDDSLVRCPYFAKCAGCQFQMLDYQAQLRQKKTVVEKAYRNFSGLAEGFVPAVQEIIGSPLQYGYRTKLTPHFDGPKKSAMKNKPASEQGKRWHEVPPIGFMRKGTRWTIDIEDCPIGTEAVVEGLRDERKRVTENIESYKRGATLLLRESTDRMSKRDTAQSDGESIEDIKTCVTDSNATSVEYVDSYRLANPAGSFFQNNNSILPRFTSYIRDHIIPADMSPPITNLIDAYCGSGLFSITLASLFSSTLGIDISPQSIDYARRNAEANDLKNAKFIAADAAGLFKEVKFSRDETAVVIDPPRKGCDLNFLGQLLDFGPKRIVYVSCNVHTKARDIGVLVNADAKERADLALNRPCYEIERLGGFDFFPQTSHVEGVAFLNRIDQTSL